MTSRVVTGLAAALVGTVLVLAPAPAAAQRRSSRVATIRVNPPGGSIKPGETINFWATAYDAQNNIDTSATEFEWTSTNPRAATVDAYGVATGVAAGVTIIKAQYGRGTRAKVGEETLQVTAPGVEPQPQAATPPAPAPAAGAPRAARVTGLGCAAQDRQPDGSGEPEGLLVSPLRLTLVKGESQQLQFRAVKGDGTNADRVCIQFSVDPGGDRIAQVDSFGVVTSMGDTGHAMLRAVVPGRGWQPKQISVEVRSDSVVFNRREISLPPGTQDTLQVVVPAQNGRALNPQMFEFSSSDSTKVRVSPVWPIVTALAPGSARITASSPVYPDIHAVVNVHKPIVRVDGTPATDTVTIAIDGTAKFGYRMLASDSSVVEAVPVHWTLPDSSIARFDTVTMMLRGVKAGTTRVVLEAQADRSHLIYHTWTAHVVAGGLDIVTRRFGLGVGERRPMAVTLLDEQRHPISPATDLRWASTDTMVAKVAAGDAVGVGMGHAVLTARSTWDSTAAADAFVVGDLLLSAQRAGRWDLLMLQHNDPSKWLALTADSAIELQMAWAPDWTRLAYVATPAPPHPEQFDLFVASANGSDVRRIVHDTVPAHSPAFVGPTGEQIVFASGRSGKSQLYVINRDGTGRRELTSSAYANTQPAVSPDGREVLFVSLRGGVYNIYEINIDGTGEQKLTSGRVDDSPSFAPDGKSFYYLSRTLTPPGKRVFKQDLSTRVATAVTPPDVFVDDYSVSADGHTVAMYVVPENQTHDGPHVELFDPATGVRTRLVLPGVDKLGSLDFRPAAPPAAAPQH
jgi:Big-like domain-containing protein/dipeptidyl peptidase IV (DPP IV)-like protein